MSLASIYITCQTLIVAIVIFVFHDTLQFFLEAASQAKSLHILPLGNLLFKMQYSSSFSAFGLILLLLLLCRVNEFVEQNVYPFHESA